MGTLVWRKDPDGSGQSDELGWSGDVPVGNVLVSGSGRWRWEIVRLPGMSAYRDDLRGWAETEAEAKGTVENMFAEWCAAAGLVQTDAAS